MSNLIYRQAAIKVASKECCELRGVFGRIEEGLNELPTVEAIPIDKPFLKMRYGDYVVYNKKWLVNHLQTEWDILQGKEYQPSIPIEFIKKYYEDITMPHTDTRTQFEGLIRKWEKENEHKESD